MKFKHLSSKLLVSVLALVIGSGMVISLLVANRFSRSLQEAAIMHGEYLSQAVALDATNKILINDLMALQNLLNDQVKSNPEVSYLFVIKDEKILAHTFSEGMPEDLIHFNTIKNSVTGNHKRIVTDKKEYFLDIAWPIFDGKAGTLRIGLSEKSYRSKMAKLWLEMASLTLLILILAIMAGILFITRITRPLTALAKATENIDEKNLKTHVKVTGKDEVSRLTTSFNQMISRISDYTRRIQKDAQDLDRAHHQTKNAFEMIQRVWAQDNLKAVCSYLTSEFQEIISCKILVFFIFSHGRETLFIFSEGELRSLKKESYQMALATLKQYNGLTFSKKRSFNSQLLPEPFRLAKHVAAFPIPHENQLLGALLVPCPDDCECVLQELDIISLILNHAAPAIKQAVSREEEMQHIHHRINVTTEFCGIVGKDPKMQTIYKLIEDIAPTDTTILIQGESGTGKELVASAIHQQSLRSDTPFVVINCSAYPSTLLESELFGHEKGAFTGAVRRKIGRFEQADKGTVFLDEIGEIPPSGQIKLLRVLQTQKFERVGGEKTLSVDVRIIAATNKNLIQEVKDGHFREDLYYRLNVIPIHLPPLQDRRNDIPLQARYFMKRFAKERKKGIKEFSSEAMRLILDYLWPGNVRELENCIEHAVVLARGDRIEVSDLPPALLSQKIDSGTLEHATGTMMESEVKLLRHALEFCNWNKKQAAKRLGISRNTLYRKLKKYQIKVPTLH